MKANSALKIIRKLPIQRFFSKTLSAFKFEPNGRVKVSKDDQLIKNHSDLFGLKSIESASDLLFVLKKGAGNYSINELLDFFERYCEIKYSPKESGEKSEIEKTILSQFKEKLKAAANKIKPYSTTSFSGPRKSSEELEAWAEEEARRVAHNADKPKLGRLALALSRLDVSDPELWTRMERMVLNDQFDDSFDESVNCLEGFIYFENVLDKIEQIEDNFGQKRKAIEDTKLNNAALFSSSIFILPPGKEQNFGAQKNLAVVQKHAELSNAPKKLTRQKRMRQMFRIFERNALISITESNLERFARMAVALTRSGSPNNISYKILESYVRSHLGSETKPKTLLSIFTAFSIAKQGSLEFYDTLSATLFKRYNPLNDLMNNGFLTEGKLFVEYLECLENVRQFYPEFDFEIETKMKMIDCILENRTNFDALESVKVFCKIPNLRLTENELINLRRAVFAKIIAGLKKEDVSSKDLREIFETLRNELSLEQQEILESQLIQKLPPETKLFEQNNKLVELS